MLYGILFAPADVQHLDLTFSPGTVVDTDKTSHYCQIFRLPTDKEYHLIGEQPLIDNHDVTHHISLRACPTPDSKAS